MAYDIPKFLKRKGNSLLFAEDNAEFVFIVPEIYFKKGDSKGGATIVGDYVELVGILDYVIYRNGKHDGLKRFMFPSVFSTQPSDIEKVKDVKLTSNTDADDYRLLKYKKDDMVVINVMVHQDIEYTEAFYSSFLTGKLPTTIPYDKIQDYMIESANLNGVSYNMSIQMFGILISEMCRDPKDMSRPFRLSNYTNKRAYKAINITDVPKLTNPFSSLMSERWDEGLTNAMINQGTKSSSVMERILF